MKCPVFLIRKMAPLIDWVGRHFLHMSCHILRKQFSSRSCFKPTPVLVMNKTSSFPRFMRKITRQTGFPPPFSTLKNEERWPNSSRKTTSLLHHIPPPYIHNPGIRSTFSLYLPGPVRMSHTWQVLRAINSSIKLDHKSALTCERIKKKVNRSRDLVHKERINLLY